MSERQTETRSAPAHIRLLAMVYDAVIVVAIWTFTVVVLVTLTGDVFTGAALQTIWFVETFAFFAFFWMHRGQTIGMLAWRLKLVAARPFTLRLALLRFIGALVGALAFGIGYMWMFFDRERRSWSDIVSNSRVVRYPKATSVRSPNH